MRKLAKQIGKSHVLAQQLWDTGIHEARILEGLIDEPEKVDETQMEQWVRDFEEFVKRAGFALMSVLASHDKKASDEAFLKFFPAIEKESVDERNYVKKAVNWALRQMH